MANQAMETSLPQLSCAHSHVAAWLEFTLTSSMSRRSPSVVAVRRWSESVARCGSCAKIKDGGLHVARYNFGSQLQPGILTVKASSCQFSTSNMTCSSKVGHAVVSIDYARSGCLYQKKCILFTSLSYSRFKELRHSPCTACSVVQCHMLMVSNALKAT